MAENMYTNDKYKALHHRVAQAVRMVGTDVLKGYSIMPLINKMRGCIGAETYSVEEIREAWTQLARDAVVRYEEKFECIFELPGSGFEQAGEYLEWMWKEWIKNERL